MNNAREDAERGLKVSNRHIVHFSAGSQACNAYFERPSGQMCDISPPTNALKREWQKEAAPDNPCMRS